MVTDGGGIPGVNLSNTAWGSTLAGVFAALVLYGISILQTFLYYERHTKDSIILRSLVAWVFILDTLHTVLISAGVWQYFVVHFGDGKFLAYTHAPLVVSVVVTSVVSSTVQSFFVYRVLFLIRSRFRWLFPAIIMPFVVAQLVLGAFYTVVAIAFQTSISAVYGPLLTKAANALNGIAAAVDITITVSLCTLLAMGRTGSADTDKILLRLIFISVNTGLSSALFAFLAVILLVVYPAELLCTALYFPLCTVYCNTLLANLNVRSFVRGGNESKHCINVHSSIIWRQNYTRADHVAGLGLEPKEIAGAEPVPTANA